MPRYIISDKQMVSGSTSQYLTNNGLNRVLYETDDQWEMYRDPMRQGTVIVYENKPRDMPVYGVKWEELQG